MEEFNERDLFASFAMNGLITKLPIKDFSRETIRPEYADIAFSAYEYADAMMNEKQKRDAGITAYGGNNE